MDTNFDKESCGTGFVANTSGRPEHRVLQLGLEGLRNLAHRGGIDADGETGDGAGVLIQLPRAFFAEEIKALTGTRPADDDVAVGWFFLPQQSDQRRDCYLLVEETLRLVGVTVFGWRWVPHNASVLSSKARDSMPYLRQVLLGRDPGWTELDFERRLYLARRTIDRKLVEAGMADVYMPSMSCRTIVYKGLFRADQVGEFYLDLQNPAFTTACCLFHVRYGTNTFPKWELAHPYRRSAHNGEINTICGNRHWLHAREQEWTSAVWGEDLAHFSPVLQWDESDSASLDRTFELLELTGWDPIQAMMMLMPEPWENKTTLPADLRGFYECHAGKQEPWDGPACVVYTDGRIVAAKLDRNGLRPARYKRYRDGLVVLASEAGIFDLLEADVVEKGRLGPSQMIAIDLVSGEFHDYAACRTRVAERYDYADWCAQQVVTLATLQQTDVVTLSGADLTVQQIGFGWSAETLKDIVHPMAEGVEPTSSMGNDAALAVLSLQPKPLAWYFHALFAQVTNPPIDSLRESVAMSLHTWLGRRGSWLDDQPGASKLLRLKSPVLAAEELAALQTMTDPAFKTERISCLAAATQFKGSFVPTLQALCQQTEVAIKAGATILVLTDRGGNADQVPLPMLLVVGAVHHHLIRQGLRTQADLVAETGVVHDVHSLATLIGYGCSAVCPYLAYASITEADAQLRYRQMLEQGLLKVMAMMGVSTLRGYHGAQLFNAVGIGHEVVDTCFTRTVTQLGGIGFAEIAHDTLRRHTAAYHRAEVNLQRSGDYKAMRGEAGGEAHAVHPSAIQAMRKFQRAPSASAYQDWADQVTHQRLPVHLRDLWRFVPRSPIPVAEVEPIAVIVRRFITAAMSDGALSPLANETLAIAMNRLAARSNGGEGGEDAARFGTEQNSAIKQVASGRFGVTPAYLQSARELEIKIVQGAKPALGGQLPAFKVTLRVAGIRRVPPGRKLFSPAPHHDIYCIEDLKQLIFDLRQLHPGARIGVKLVSCVGIGTVAAGVAKAGADVILIAGHDGGTGAAPLNAIKHAGNPWEMGLAEAHQVLIDKAWRERVVLRVDGGLRTAHDVLVAACLGAEEFGFGTLAAMGVGCVMARQCHLNTCPVGVATQDENLWKRFTGTPEHVIELFTALAEDVRKRLATLGCQRFGDIIGRSELLQLRPLADFPLELHPKIRTLDTARLIASSGTLRRTMQPIDLRSDPPANLLDDAIAVEHAAVLTGVGRVTVERSVNNHDRNIGTRLAGIIAGKFGDAGLPDHTAVTLRLTGSAGQSLGAFLVKGMCLELAGEANDGVGKSLCGGDIIIRPPHNSGYDDWWNHCIIGNTALYGATAGRLFAAGQAGERFAVRNSGATAVVEGVGDHACTFMTRGVVVSIGDALGWNFGSGMTGGWVCLYDPSNRAPRQMHADVVLTRLTEVEDIAVVRGLLEEHHRFTGSPRAREILEAWADHLRHFWVVRARP